MKFFVVYQILTYIIGVVKIDGEELYHHYTVESKLFVEYVLWFQDGMYM